jgi:hypothetical protein
MMFLMVGPEGDDASNERMAWWFDQLTRHLEGQGIAADAPLTANQAANLIAAGLAILPTSPTAESIRLGGLS